MKYNHGGDIYDFEARFGYIPIDFSVSVNPLPMPLNVKIAYDKAFDSCGVYPDYQGRKLKAELSSYEGVETDYIFCGNGASDIIYRIFLGLKPKTLLNLAPTFAEYETAAEFCGSKTINYFLDEASGFSLGDKFLESIKNIDCLILCNPNNPTGVSIEPPLMDKIVKICAERGIILIVDECFIDLAETAQSLKKYLHVYDNLIIIKAFTKFFPMAGLRLGYCLASNGGFLEKISKAGHCWSISSTALACGEAVLKEAEFIKETISIIKAEKQFLLQNFANLPLKIYGHDANFIFFRTTCLDLDKQLETHGIMIRNCNNFHGLSQGFFRVGVRNRDDNEVLIQKLRQVLHG